MNPFVWIMALRSMWRAGKAFDEGTPEEKAAFYEKMNAPFQAFEDGLSGVGPKTQPLIRRPFRIALYILLLVIFVSMVIGGL
jgi:hypothetical protein